MELGWSWFNWRLQLLSEAKGEDPFVGFSPPLSLCHSTGSILPNSNPDGENWSKIFKAGISSLHQLGLLLTGYALLSYIYIIDMS